MQLFGFTKVEFRCMLLSDIARGWLLFVDPAFCFVLVCGGFLVLCLTCTFSFFVINIVFVSFHKKRKKKTKKEEEDICGL